MFPAAARRGEEVSAGGEEKKPRAADAGVAATREGPPPIVTSEEPAMARKRGPAVKKTTSSPSAEWKKKDKGGTTPPARKKTPSPRAPAAKVTTPASPPAENPAKDNEDSVSLEEQEQARLRLYQRGRAMRNDRNRRLARVQQRAGRRAASSRGYGRDRTTSEDRTATGSAAGDGATEPGARRKHEAALKQQEIDMAEKLKKKYDTKIRTEKGDVIKDVL